MRAPPQLHLGIAEAGQEAVLRLSGAFTHRMAIPAFTLNGETPARIRIENAGINEWDSTLLMLVQRIQTQCHAAGVPLDIDDLPAGAKRLLALAATVPERSGARRSETRSSWLARMGTTAIRRSQSLLAVLDFIGEAALSFARFVSGRARYRRSDFFYIIEQCGPQALGIVTTISLLVGAILAFVGAIQLRMFGAEIYVANLVGLGMVMEMGALMTGIILAGRTGASFAAQLGTMQVNEEIDALRTLGIPPMDYLVMPRMVALALMTPLLVIYANVLGILGGAAVGVLALGISPVVYFNQTFELMTPYYCAQGLIKGSTFGVLVACCGCWSGMRCGRSASAVGEAATAAVVTSIVAIVLADAVWTFIFMVAE